MLSSMLAKVINSFLIKKVSKKFKKNNNNKCSYKGCVLRPCTPKQQT